MLTGTKPSLASKGVLGGAAAAIAGLVGLAGYAVEPGDVSSIFELTTSLISTIGGVVAIVGRVLATKKIG